MTILKTEYHNYSFIVDGGLNVCVRAEDEEIALARIKRSWPRSDVALKGIDLPSADRFNPPAPRNEQRPVLATAPRVESKRKEKEVVHADYADAINAAIDGSVSV